MVMFQDVNCYVICPLVNDQQDFRFGYTIMNICPLGIL